MFERLIHSDWSKDAPGRVTAIARRSGSGWHVDVPAPTGDLVRFVETICEPTPTLAGFDFPIGLPTAFGAATGLQSFPQALTRFGMGEWADFYRVARTADEISPRRPFYPDAPGGRRHDQLLAGLRFNVITDLLRRCERAQIGRAAASPLFWTMGAKQVGKAAINGWRDVVGPARERGCRLWPFDGDLDAVGNVIAETYPAEAYAHVGVVFGRSSKEDPAARARVAPALFEWAARSRVDLTPALAMSLSNGFASHRNGSDHFDALLGLLGMIEVEDGRRAAAPADIDRVWEGWILGQA